MGILTRKKNTSLGNPNLCRSCAWAQFMTGYGDREKLAVCTHTNPNMVIPFAMLECTGFSDRNLQEAGKIVRTSEMTAFAIDTQSGRPTARTGLAPVEPLRPARTTRSETGAVPIRTRVN
jgi:hypothetical protein